MAAFAINIAQGMGKSHRIFCDRSKTEFSVEVNNKAALLQGGIKQEKGSGLIKNSSHQPGPSCVGGGHIQVFDKEGFKVSRLNGDQQFINIFVFQFRQ